MINTFKEAITSFPPHPFFLPPPPPHTPFSSSTPPHTLLFSGGCELMFQGYSHRMRLMQTKILAWIILEWGGGRGGGML